MDINQDDVRGDIWAGFDWSSWQSLDPSDNELDDVPRTSGLYRVRHIDREGLEYVGQTGRKLREAAMEYGSVPHYNSVSPEENPGPCTI